MFFCVTYSSFDILGSVAVKTKAVFPSIITNAFGVNLICNSLVPWLFTSIYCYCFNFSKSSEMMNFHFCYGPQQANEILSQWRFRSCLEMQYVSSIFCFSGRRMEYLISLFLIGLFILHNERKFINSVFSIQKNYTYYDCFIYSIYILYLSHHSAIIHLSV